MYDSISIIYARVYKLFNLKLATRLSHNNKKYSLRVLIHCISYARIVYSLVTIININDLIEKHLKFVNHLNEEVIIMGDFNINYMDTKSNENFGTMIGI